MNLYALITTKNTPKKFMNSQVNATKYVLRSFLLFLPVVLPPTICYLIRITWILYLFIGQKQKIMIFVFHIHTIRSFCMKFPFCLHSHDLLMWMAVYVGLLRAPSTQEWPWYWNFEHKRTKTYTKNVYSFIYIIFG